MLTLSCGHDVDDLDNAYDIQVKSTDGNGNRSVEYVVVCGECALWYQEQELILRNTEEVAEWLGGSIQSLVDELSDHPDPRVRELCRLAGEMAANESFSLHIDNLSSFTTVIGGQVITGIGKLVYHSKEILLDDLQTCAELHAKMHGNDEFHSLLMEAYEEVLVSDSHDVLRLSSGQYTININ